uniref:RRM domain-containing protein n=1 Tax=Macrostomum lignano TaxID=282301 RepID=A0A1I8F8V3_9PLAT
MPKPKCTTANSRLTGTVRRPANEPEASHLRWRFLAEACRSSSVRSFLKGFAGKALAKNKRSNKVKQQSKSRSSFGLFRLARSASVRLLPDSSMSGSSSRQFVPPVSRARFVYRRSRPTMRRRPSGRSSTSEQPAKMLKIASKMLNSLQDRVTRLTRNVARAHLEEIFGMYGALRRIDIPADRQHPELTRGFAIIEFESPGEAADACRHMDGGQIDGQEIQARLVNPEPPRHNNAGGGRRPAPAGRAGRRRRSSS